MGHRAFLGILLILPLVAGSSRADPVAETADRVLAAYGAKDETGLETLAGTNDPDPWLVADELCARGEHDAAKAFARVSRRPDLDGLPSLVTARRSAPASPEVRAALRRAADGWPGDPRAVLDALADVGKVRDPFLAVRVSGARGLALRALGRHAEGHEALIASAAAAERLGWLRRVGRDLTHAADAAWNLGQAPQAISLAEKLVALGRRRRSPVDEAAALFGLAGYQHRPLRFQTCRKHLERALALLEEVGPEDRRIAAKSAEDVETQRALTLVRLAYVMKGLGEADESIRLARRAAGVFERLGVKRRLAHTLGVVGELLATHGRCTEALPALERAHDLCSELGDERTDAWVCKNLGFAHTELGNYEKALSCLDESHSLAERTGHAWIQARVRQRKGDVYERRGQYAEALAAHLDALEGFRKLRDPTGTADVLSDLGIVYWRLCRWDEAVSSLEEAKQIHTNARNEAGVATAELNLGLVYHWLCETDRALEHFERARALYEKRDDRDGLACALNNIGMALGEQGHLARCLAAFERAAEIAGEAGDRATQAAALGNLASAYRILGDLGRALRVHVEALAIKEQVQDRAGAAMTRTNLALIHLYRKEFGPARRLAQQALLEHGEIGNRRGEAQALRVLGDIEIVSGDPGRARRYREQALAISEETNDVTGAAVDLINLAHSDEVAEAYERAVAGYRRARSEATRVEQPRVEVLGLIGESRTRLRQGKADAALALAKSAIAKLPGLIGGLSQETGAAAREVHAKLFDVAARAALLTDDAPALSYVLESGRAGTLLETLGGRESLHAAILPDRLCGELTRARREETAAAKSLREAREEGRVAEIRRRLRELDAARERVRSVIQRIQREAKEAAKVLYPETATLAEIQARLRDGEALALYALTSREALALLVTPRETRIVALGETAGIAAACEALAWVGRASTKEGPDATAAVRALRARVVDPLELGPEVTRLLISPHGALSEIPFALLTDREVAYVPSGTTYGHLRDGRKEPAEEVLALGDPDYGARVDRWAAATYRRGGDELTPLPASREEAKAVGDVVLLGKEATETRFAQVAGARRWRAVHLACHGLVDAERPTLSSLAVTPDEESDGFLTCLEVFRMKIPADLVVLSACETAKGKVYKVEGILGLTRAFMTAGASRVLVSLWKVDDAATRALMVKFYELWNPGEGREGMPTATALKKAQGHVRDHPDHPEWTHPYYWAAWQLWGLPD